MPRTVELDEFAGKASALIDAVAAGDESVVVVRSGSPIAVLSPLGAPEAQAILSDLPRWEEWVHEVREFAQTGGRGVAPQVALPDPPQLDKALLGFDPGSGTVGSDAGRE